MPSLWRRPGAFRAAAGWGRKLSIDAMMLYTPPSGPRSWQRGMGQRCRGCVPGAAHQIPPFRPVRLGLQAVGQVNRNMRGFVAKNLQQELTWDALEPGVEPDDPARRTDAAEGARQARRELDRHPIHKAGCAPKRCPAGQNPGQVEGGLQRSVRHGSLRQRTVCRPADGCIHAIGEWAGLQAGRTWPGRFVGMLSEQVLGSEAHPSEIGARPEGRTARRSASLRPPDRCSHARRIRDPLGHPLGEGRRIPGKSGGDDWRLGVPAR